MALGGARQLDAALSDARSRGALRRPTPDEPLRVVDLGCGNAYLTFAAHRFLTHVRGLPVHLVGADVKQQSADHNGEVAASLGVDEQMSFAVGTIGDVVVDPAPDVVLALHACDTATDDALARAVGWQAPVVLAAPGEGGTVTNLTVGVEDAEPPVAQDAQGWPVWVAIAGVVVLGLLLVAITLLTRHRKRQLGASSEPSVSKTS